MSRDEFVFRVQEDLERRRIAKYQPYCQNQMIEYKTDKITRRMKREKRRYYR